jgi:flagellar P-ring protein precursor FlgI
MDSRLYKQNPKMWETAMVNKNSTANILFRFLFSVLCVGLIAIGTAESAPKSAKNAASSAGKTRIKDIIDIEGVRDNMLVGYGLVVGLNGTGDTLNNSPFTQQSIIGMLDRLGVNVRDEKVNTKNIAAVIVSATLPPFSNNGTRIDVTISALGDAKSLQGGTLLVTPLLGADSQVYAVAQGPVSVSGFTASGDGGSVTQNIPTAGRIAAGAIIEREIPFTLADATSTRLSLRNPDFTTAERVASAINEFLGAEAAQATNPSTIALNVPAGYKGGLIGLITDIEQLRITPDQIARVLIDEKSGVIVMGSEVRISTVAIAQGNLTIRVTETPQVSQPQAFAQQGTTTVVPRTDIQVDSGDSKLALLPQGVTLQELVTSLNALGVGPRDIITILQSIKAAGAMQAEIEVM